MPIGLLSLMAILPPGFAWADFTQYPLAVLTDLQRPDLAHGDLFRLCLDLHEPLSRRDRRPQSPLLFPFRSAARGATRRQYFSGLITSVILFTTVTVVVDVSCFSFPTSFAERALFSGRSRDGTAAHLCRNYHAGVASDTARSLWWLVCSFAIQ